jgi:hypothetical protein
MYSTGGRKCAGQKRASRERQLTDCLHSHKIAAMRKMAVVAIIAAFSMLAGCGLAYQAASGYRANKMAKSLYPGLAMADVHQMYGEPDIRAYPDQSSEIWSYAKHANTNDMTAAVLYTSAKEGDKGTFEDLKFVNGHLESWGEAQHTMPAKESSGFTIGTGNGPGGVTPGTHY